MAHILVLSDDPQAREHAVLALEKTHHEVFATGGAELRRSAAAALGRTLRAFAPDLVIVDLSVLESASQGAEKVLAALAPENAEGAGGQATLVRAPAVLVLIAMGREDQIIPSFEAGADDYVLKPIDARDLRAKAELLLGSRAHVRPKHQATEPDRRAYDKLSISDDGKLQHEDGSELSEGDLPGTLGRYEVTGILGKGGYGTVYRARDIARDQRPVALKVLPATATHNAEAVARFFRESAAIARLDHPNIVKFHELGSVKGRFYFTMELVEGITLKAVVEREAPLEEARAAAFIAQAANALSALSSLGYVHRDIKPENMIVCREANGAERLKLIDFGLVKIHDAATITSNDDVLGTPYFMAPEYISAACKPDVRYDLYSLGVTFFNLLTGQYPFEGKNAAHVMEKHLREAAPAPSSRNPRVTPAADRVVLRMLEKDPNKRPRDAEELVVMLRGLMPYTR